MSETTWPELTPEYILNRAYYEYAVLGRPKSGNGENCLYLNKSQQFNGCPNRCVAGLFMPEDVALQADMDGGYIAMLISSWADQSNQNDPCTDWALDAKEQTDLFRSLQAAHDTFHVADEGSESVHPDAFTKHMSEKIKKIAADWCVAIDENWRPQEASNEQA